MYVVVNNYRNDDYGNYLYRTTDNGETWTSIVGDLPAERVLRTVREDPRNPRVLWLGSELGLFVSTDGGAHWTELRANLPTLPYNDLVVHPRDNDLVLATHGRGVWILDNVNAIQEATPEVLASPAHLFTLEPAEMIRYASTKAHTGDMVFQGENPPPGAIIDYYLGEAADSGTVSITIRDASGQQINEVEPKLEAGINRVIWNLRHENLPAPPDEDRGRSRRPPGPWVVPGSYTVRLDAGGRSYEQSVEVREDPRLEIAPAERRAWTETLLEIADLYGEATAEVAALAPLARQLDADSDTAKVEDAPAAAAEMVAADTTAEQVRDVADPDPAAGAAAVRVTLDDATLSELEELNEDIAELHSRIGRLYFDASGWTGPLTADQRSQFRFYQQKLEELRPRVRALVERAGE